MTESTAGLTIVIGSYLEADLVARIAAAPPVARVAYEPDLLPVPRYRCDHNGRRARPERGRASAVAVDRGQRRRVLRFRLARPGRDGGPGQARAAALGAGDQRRDRGVHAADRARPQRPDRHHRGRHPRGAAGRVRGHGGAALRQGRARPAAAAAGEALGAVHDQAAGGPAGARGRARRRSAAGWSPASPRSAWRCGASAATAGPTRSTAWPRSSPARTWTRRCPRSTSSSSPAR